MARDTRDPMVKAIEAIGGRMVKDLPDHPTAKQLQGMVNRLHGATEALDRVMTNRNPLDTPDAHALKVAKMARKLDTEILASLNQSGRIWADGVQAVQRRIDEKVDLRPDAFATEIRGAFRGLDSKAKAALLKELVEGNRGPELAAIVRAPSVVAGISDKEKADYEKAIVGKHAAAEIDEQDKLGEVFEAIMVAHRAATDFAKRLTDPDKVAAIERGAAQAAAAGAAFDQSLQ